MSQKQLQHQDFAVVSVNRESFMVQFEDMYIRSHFLTTQFTVKQDIFYLSF